MNLTKKLADSCECCPPRSDSTVWPEITANKGDSKSDANQEQEYTFYVHEDMNANIHENQKNVDNWLHTKNALPRDGAAEERQDADSDEWDSEA